MLPPSDGGHARIRIFTPVAELPFAGHPVLGSAFVLGAPLQLGEIQLETGAGIVPVALEREGARITFGWMAQPIPQWEPYAGADELLGLLERALKVLNVSASRELLQQIAVYASGDARSANDPAVFSQRGGEPGKTGGIRRTD